MHKLNQPRCQPLPEVSPGAGLPLYGALGRIWHLREGMTYLSPAPLYHAAPNVGVNLTILPSIKPPPYADYLQAIIDAVAGGRLEIAGEIGLAGFLIGEGARKPTSAILADAVEALLGAVFLDAGFEAAAELVERLWGARFDSNEIAERPAKSRLQEWAQGKGRPLPSYRVAERTGSDHAPTFTVEVTVQGVEPLTAQGRSRQEAEKAAATAMLKREGVI